MVGRTGFEPVKAMPVDLQSACYTKVYFFTGKKLELFYRLSSLKMPKAPTFPPGIRVYHDTDGTSDIWRVFMGVKFLGKGNKPQKKAFAVHSDAIDFARAELQKRTGNPEEARKIGLSESTVLDAKYAIQKLAGKATLVEAAESWLRLVEPYKSAPTVKEAIRILVDSKEKEGHGERHLQVLFTKLTRIFQELEAKKISEVTRQDMETASPLGMEHRRSRTRRDQ